jgi:hypothetical protein
MGEAKRRKLSDPTWGKGGRGSYKEAKEAREYARLIAKAKRDVPGLAEKLPAVFLEEMEKLTDPQQEQMATLGHGFAAGVRHSTSQQEKGRWLEDFLEEAKQTVDPEVFELFLWFLDLQFSFPDSL